MHYRNLQFVMTVALVAAIILGYTSVAVSASDADKKSSSNVQEDSPKDNIPRDVHTIMAQFERQSYSRRHDAIKQLREMRSEESQQALLSIASGAYEDKLTEWAARSYVCNLEDKNDAKQLLQASNWKVRHVGWLALPLGMPMDKQLLEKMKEDTQSEHLHLRRGAARMASQAAVGPLSNELVLALVKSLETIEKTPSVWRSISVLHDKTTDGGYAYGCLTGDLMRIKGVELAWLKTLTPKKSGNPRDCVLIARAAHGDSTVKSELKRVISESSIYELRYKALGTFRTIGDANDIPYLKTLKESDSFTMTPHAQLVAWLKFKGLPTDKYYPIRMAASDTLGALRRRLQAEQDQEQRDEQENRR